MDVRTLTIHGQDALAFLEEQLAKFPETGEYPFLLGEDDDLEMLEETHEDLKRTAEDYIRESRQIDAAEWFAQAAQVEREEFDEDDEDFNEDELIGEWPDELPEDNGLYLPRNSSGKGFRSQLIVGFARIQDPWHPTPLTLLGCENKS